MPKPSLSFYTNIPTPYQLSFFEELSKCFDLKVIYYTASENNREWNFKYEQIYIVKILRDNFIARFIQKWVLDFHFSWEIFSVVWSDRSNYIIVGGSYATANATVALLFSRFKGKKVVYFSEPLLNVDNIIKYKLKWLYLRILNICCDAIFCIGKKAVDSFISYQVSPIKFMVPYNINETNFQHLDPARLDEIKTAYKSNSELIILSSGALIHRKGMDILIRAMKDIDHPGLKLIIVGNGPQKEELVKIAEKDRRVVFAGFQEPGLIPYFFGIADIFAFASRYDGWGVVINEAIAANLPIISSDMVGAAVELISSPFNGILCQSDNVPAFKEAIDSLVFNNDKRQAMKNNVQQLVPLISSRYNAHLVYDIFLRQIN